VVDVLDVGRIAGRVMRRGETPDGQQTLGVRFDLPAGEVRDALIRRLYTQGLDNSAKLQGAVTLAILARVLRRDSHRLPPAPLPEAPPGWAAALVAAAPTDVTIRAWERDARIEAQSREGRAA
jgi:hypothetical protein